MAELRSGVLVKFLQEMDINGKECRNSKPVLLQIREIIPLLREGDLWPYQGFFIKVSDLSHSLYASLPPKEDQMVLCDKLHLGQFIYVEKLESSYPVPMLKGIKPLPGRHPCCGNPKDLLPAQNLRRLCGVSDMESIEEDGGDENSGSLSSSRVSSKERIVVQKPVFCRALKVKSNERMGRRRNVENRGSGVQKHRLRHANEDSDDSESTTSAMSSQSLSKRRSWNGKEVARVGENSDDAVIKHEVKPTATRIPRFSSCPVTMCESSDDDSSCTSKSSGIGIARKSSRLSRKRATLMTGKRSESIRNKKVSLSSINEEKDISRDLLPPNLMKLHQEVLRQRDMALLAAAEALQEAAAADGLLKCLRKYSDLRRGEGCGQYSSVDRFFSLQDDLAQTRLVCQSLEKKTETADQSSPPSYEEILKLTLDRTENASSWIKAALASDMNPVPDQIKNRITPERSSAKPGHCNKPKGQVHGSTPNAKNETESVRGKTSEVAAELVNSLQNECKTWFLTCVEGYLNWVSSRTDSTKCDAQIAEMMWRIKRVNDWLDMRCRDTSTLDSEIQACERIRNKIYGILLKHAERTAMNYNDDCPRNGRKQN